MLTAVALLVAGIALVFVAFFLGILVLALYTPDPDNDDPEREKRRRLVGLALSVVAIIAAVVASRIYLHIQTHEPPLLQAFWIWYTIGIISRFFLLVHRHYVFSPLSATDWSEVQLVLVFGLGGPFTTIHLIHELVFGKYQDR